MLMFINRESLSRFHLSRKGGELNSGYQPTWNKCGNLLVKKALENWGKPVKDAWMLTFSRRFSRWETPKASGGVGWGKPGRRSFREIAFWIEREFT